MARLPRLTVPGQPHHVIQSGNNGQPVFVDDEDREMLVALVHRYAASLQVAVHAYALLPNRIRLLVTPARADGLPRLMQSVGRAYVRYFNARHGRTGTLWEGRYRATVLQPERYLVPCMASMDLAPVKAHLCASPGDYRWSSFGHYAGRRSDRLLTPHAVYWHLANTPFEREAAYVRQVESGLANEDESRLMESALRGWALGDAAYLAELQRRTGRRVTKSRAGRPPKQQ